MYDQGVKCLQCNKLLYKGGTISHAMAGRNCCPHCGQNYSWLDLCGGNPGFEVVTIRLVRYGFLNCRSEWVEVKVHES